MTDVEEKVEEEDNIADKIQPTGLGQGIAPQAAKAVKVKLEKGEKLLDSYIFDADGIPVNVKIVERGDFVPHYDILIPGLGEGTKIVLNTLKGELITEVKLDITEMLDQKLAKVVRKKFEEKAMMLLSKHFPTLSEDTKKVLMSYLIHHSLGLGELESPMHDDNLEEIVINGSSEPIWVYHKKFGWCKTNIRIKSEEVIYDYAAMIGRRVGRQINVLNPLMDAHLVTGDRVNATLFPISTCGNTLTIRRFSRNPWTITNLLINKTINADVAALIWLAIQNELSLIISGGTGSGKTSFLNAICCFIPPNHRIISIEDTRELTLPKFFQWVPMTTREPNAEGKGEITMLDLLVNALRQRPDRILVGEIRRQREAEILFEAMHTGHAVYATLHADNAKETISRLTNPPINVPKTMLEALGGIVVQFRHRRMGLRRTLEFAEVMKGGNINILYRWDIKTDQLKEMNTMSVLVDTLTLYAGMTLKEIKEDMEEKASILKWMVKNNIREVNEVGQVIAKFYRHPDELLEIVKVDKPWIEEKTT